MLKWLIILLILQYDQGHLQPFYLHGYNNGYHISWFLFWLGSYAAWENELLGIIISLIRSRVDRPLHIYSLKKFVDFDFTGVFLVLIILDLLGYFNYCQ